MALDDSMSPRPENAERDPETYRILGCAFAVHSQLGSGFLESVYQEALAIEFEIGGIPFRREAPITVLYRDRPLVSQYRADFLCYDGVIVELKAVSRLDTCHEAQVIHYLKATGMQRALLLNFGAPRLEYKRLVLTKHLRTSASSAEKDELDAV
jgi:GxxExxY protein